MTKRFFLVWCAFSCSCLFCTGSISDEDLLKLIRSRCPETDHDTKCATEMMTDIQDWLNRNSKYRILVTGKMGSGKTTFIRGLTEDFVPPTDSLLPHTITVDPYNKHREGSNCIFFDTPGLKDNEKSSNDYTYLKEMVQKNQEPNLLIFAIKMNDFVFHEEDLEAMHNISGAFGWKIWQRSLFILTFANMVAKVGHKADSVESKLHFSKMFNQRHLDIAQALRKTSVQEEVINDIPVIPVGLVSQPNLPVDGREVSWIEEFWQEAFKILRKTKPTFSSPYERNREEHDKKSPEATSYWSLLLSILSLFLSILYYIWMGWCCFITAFAVYLTIYPDKKK